MHDLISQFLRGIRKYSDAYYFIRKYRLWEGFGNYKIVSWVLILGAGYLGYKFLSIFRNKISDIADEGFIGMGAEVFSTTATVFRESYDFLFAGTYRYLIFLLLEVLIFHFAVRTVEILSHRDFKLTAKVFIHAQFRVLKLIIFNFGVELIVAAFLGFMLGIFGLGWLKAGLMFILQCFLMGFLVIDNFNEIQGSGIRTSFKRTTKHLGAAIGLGLPLYLIMFIPVIGAIVGPIIGVVAGSLLMYELEPEILHEQEIMEEEFAT
jgi:hypothetical protein